MISKLNHPGLECNETDNGEIEINGVCPFDMIVRLEYETGIVGEGWSEWRLFHAGTDIDNMGWELAKEHAESYGHYEDVEDEDDFDIADCCASVYWYNPEISDAYINGGSPNGSIFNTLINMGYITEKGEVVAKGIENILHIRNKDDLDALTGKN